MNQIICLSNLLSGRFLQKRAMLTKLDIYVSVFLWTAHPSDGTRMCVYCMENITHILHVKKQLVAAIDVYYHEHVRLGRWWPVLGI